MRSFTPSGRKRPFFRAQPKTAKRLGRKSASKPRSGLLRAGVYPRATEFLGLGALPPFADPALLGAATPRDLDLAYYDHQHRLEKIGPLQQERPG